MDDLFDEFDAPRHGIVTNLLDNTSDYFDGVAPPSEPEEVVTAATGQETENQPTTDDVTKGVRSALAVNKMEDQQRSVLSQSEEEPRPMLTNLANLEAAPTSGAPAPNLSAPAPTASEDPSQLPTSIREAEDLGRLAMFGNQPKIKRRSQLRREQREQEGTTADLPQMENPSQPVARSRSAHGRSPSVEIVGERNVSRPTPSQPVSRRPAGGVATSSAARARSASVDKNGSSVPVRGATPSQPASRRPMTRSGPVPVTRNRSNSATAVARAASPSLGNRPVTQPTPIARGGPVWVRGRSPSVEVVGVRRGASPAVSQPRARVVPAATQPTKTGSPRGKHGPICVATKTGATRTSAASAGVARSNDRLGAANSSGSTSTAPVSRPVTRSRSKELANSRGDVGGLATAMGGLELNANRSRDRTRRPVAVTQPVARKAPSARSNLAVGSPIPTQRAFFNQLSHREGSLGRDARPGAALGLSRPTAASAARRSQQPAPAARTITAPRPARASVPTAVRPAPTATRPTPTATRPSPAATRLAARAAVTARQPVNVGAGSQTRPRTNSTNTTATKPVTAVGGSTQRRPRVDVASLVNRLSQPRRPVAPRNGTAGTTRNAPAAAAGVATPVRGVPPIRYTHGIRSRSSSRNRPQLPSRPRAGAPPSRPVNRAILVSGPAPTSSTDPAVQSTAEPAVPPPTEPVADQDHRDAAPEEEPQQAVLPL